MSVSKRHDRAWRIAHSTLCIFGNLLRPEEGRDAFTEVYEMALRELKEFEAQLELCAQRLHPVKP